MNDTLTTERIAEIVALLKTFCDPRGHELLDALAGYLDTNERMRRELPAVNWPADNTMWSRRADDLPDNVRRIGVSR